MAICKAQQTWEDEPAKTTPMDASRLTFGETRTSEVAAEVERMIAAGALTPQQYGATGNGVTDDTTAMNNFLAAAKEKAGVIPPGQYKCTGALTVPPLSDISGVNGRTTRILRSGNGDLFDLQEGDIAIRNLLVEAAAPQASGSAFELSGAGGTDVRLDSITLGSNFFNGFSLIPTTLGGSIHVSRIRVVALASGVKSMGGAVFVLGNSANRLVGANLEDIQGIANTKADVKAWIEANNCDSCWLSNILFQTGQKGVVVGNNDTSAEKTTNMQFSQVICDGGAEGMDQGWFMQNAFATDMLGCHGQGAEAFIGTEVHGLTWTGGTLQMCRNNGLRIGAASVQPILLQGVKIGNNNITLPAGTKTNGEASPLSADVQFEPGCARVMLIGCPVGNVMNYGGTCRSLFAFWFAATGNGTKLAQVNCPYVKSGDQKAFMKYAFTATRATNEIYGFETGEPVPSPLTW